MKQWAPYAFPDPVTGKHRNQDLPNGIRGSWPDGLGYQQIIDELFGLTNAAGLPASALDSLQVTQAVRSSALIYRQATGTANALLLTMAPGPLPGNYAQLRMLIINATLANTRADVTINIDGLGARLIRGRGGRKLRSGEIQPGPLLLIDTGSAYELVGSGGSQRTLLQGAITLYVAPNGSDTLNDGLDPASPFLTIQRAWSELVNNYDLNGYPATIQLADGSYTAGLTATSAPIGSTAGVGAVTLRGNAGNAAAVLVSTTGGANGFLGQAGAQFTVRDLTIQCAGSNANALVANPGGVIAWANVRFGVCTNAHVNCSNGGFAQAIGNYEIVGGAAFHLVASNGAIAQVSGRTITLTGTPNFSGQFAFAQQGRCELVSTLYGGGATGARYLAIENGVVATAGAGANGLPGNAAGSTASGGQYT